MTNPNRELAEDAALDYSDDPVARELFSNGWVSFCAGDPQLTSNTYNQDFIAGWKAARDAPE